MEGCRPIDMADISEEGQRGWTCFRLLRTSVLFLLEAARNSLPSRLYAYG